MKNPYRRLLSETGVYAISSLGSKIILLALLPIYTNYLTEAEFGTVDLVTVMAQLLLPVVSLSVFDAVLRFCLDFPDERKSILSNGFGITTLGSIVAILGSLSVAWFFPVDKELLFFGAGILVLQAFRSLFSQYARSIRRMRVFAADGIFMALVIAVSSGIALVFFDAGISGYFWSICLGNGFSVIFLFIFTDAYSSIHFRDLSRSRARQMLAYSGPLIPNAIMWWLMSSSNRFIIVYFIGLAANGLFAVASRIPSVLTVFTAIFTQAWQIIAIQNVESPDGQRVYSRVFNSFVRLNFLMVAIILVFLKPGIGLLLGASFFNAWKLLPVLLVAACFANLSTFVGTSYLTAMRTRGVLSTSIIGGVVNVGGALLLIPSFGVMGAALAKLAGSLAMFVLRVRGTRSYMGLSIDYGGLGVSLLVVALQGITLFSPMGSRLEITITGSLCVILAFFNMSYLRSMIKVVLRQG